MENKLERDVGFIRGARFYRDGDRVMFAFGIDPNNVIGPRPATPTDQANYPNEWAALAHPMDRDADGEMGGSLAGTPEIKQNEAGEKRRPGRPRRAIED